MPQIIQATLFELSEIVPLFDAYRQFYGQKTDVELAKLFLQQRLENNESVMFLAKDASMSLGFTQLYPSFSSVSAQRLWILNDLFVIPEARGKGIGELLLKHAQAFAKNQNTKGLSLSTHHTNPAQKLYEKLGWEQDQEFLNYFWKVV